MLKYTQAYTMFKEMIADGRLRRGERMPSIRRAAELTGSAAPPCRMLTSIGGGSYIYAKPQSGYFVAGGPKAPATPMPRPQVQTPPRLDLTGNSADLSSFDFSLWQRYIKSALRQRQRLLTYSEPQGRVRLAVRLADYVRGAGAMWSLHREHIVVGAGVQMLLEILCVLLKGRRTVSFPDGSFVQGSTVFAAHGYAVRTRYKDADIIYVSPSHMNRQGDVMPIQRRLELCAHSADTGAVVIEDDFENDFLYSSTPTPSLYALGSGNVVYMGAFSALLLPGIRISFMVLSPALAAAYHQMKDTFAQTASKTEQIALCAYLRDGNMSPAQKSAVCTPAKPRPCVPCWQRPCRTIRCA